MKDLGKSSFHRKKNSSDFAKAEFMHIFKTVSQKAELAKKQVRQLEKEKAHNKRKSERFVMKASNSKENLKASLNRIFVNSSKIPRKPQNGISSVKDLKR